jgi:hypothetical protein
MDPQLKLLLCGVVMAFYGLFMAAVISKYREVQRASLWIAAPARIVSSRSEARKITRRRGSGRDAIIDTEIRNFAVVRYAFKVDGRKIESDRIGIGEDLGNFQVAEKLQRYPVGTDVTVFYDKNRPENCVLERDMSGRTFKIAILAGALFGVCGLLVIFATSGVYEWLSQLDSDMRPTPGAMFLTVMGLFTAAFGYVLHQRGAATFHWPRVTGTIVSSSVDTVKMRLSLNPAYYWRTRTLYRSRTRYAYKVAGVTYESDRTSFGGQSYASFQLFAKHGAARFATGQPVDVFYNPAAPEQAVLTQGTPGQFIVWLIAAASLASAAHFGGLV